MPSQFPGAPEQGPLKVGQTFIGQYEILATIGSGGHAFVYRARHRFLGHLVALKALHRDSGVSLDMLRRGQAEAQIEFKLSHPGIVRVLDGGISDDGLLYIIMEHLSGRSAREAVQEHGRLGLREALHHMGRVAEAMHVAHAAGVVHRDLKPENLFFTIEQVTKILDFGVAKIDDVAGWQTRKDSTVGTFIYMSPEQALGLVVSPRSDIYACGIILWELIIGKQPVMFQLGERRMGFHVLANIICKEAVPALDGVDPSIPRYIVELVTQATAKAPEKRFTSMLEFAAAIRECESLLDAQEKRAGRVTTIRDLSRKVPGSSGVAQVSPSSSVPLPADDHDTVPASRPLFLGVLPSVRSPSVPPPGPAQASPASAPAAPPPSSSERPTVLARTGAGNTAPLHQPSLHQSSPPRSPSTAPISAPAPPTPKPQSPQPGSAARPSAPPIIPEPLRAELVAAPPRPLASARPVPAQSPLAVQVRAAQEAPVQLPLKSLGVVPLLWGLAAGILIFGFGAAYFLRKPTAPRASLEAPIASVEAPSPPLMDQPPLPPAPPEVTPPPASPVVEASPVSSAAAPSTSAVAAAPKPALASQPSTAKSASVTQRDIDKMNERLRSLETPSPKKTKDSIGPLPDSGLPPAPAPAPAPRRQPVF